MNSHTHAVCRAVQPILHVADARDGNPCSAGFIEQELRMQSARDALLFHGVEILAQEPPVCPNANKLIRESAAKGHRSVPWAGFRQPAREKKPCHFGPDELPRVIIIVDPLARRVRETEAHVMLLVEGG